MFNTSARSLKIISALFWIMGGVVLAFKSVELLFEANTLDKDPLWPWVAVFSGLLIGCAKVKWIFSKSCKRNLIRIDALQQPKIWQFFRPGFFLFLFAMVILGKFLSESAHGNYPFLIGMAILDISLATALLGSSYVFWAYKKRSQ